MRLCSEWRRLSCAWASARPDAAGVKGENTETDDGKISVVTTIFPPYDFVREIAGDQVEVKMLLKPGEETHSYEPTPQDIIAIQESDVFIYTGGENDVWVEDILSSMPDNDRITLRLLGLCRHGGGRTCGRNEGRGRS